jgi:hypothetical protein
VVHRLGGLPISVLFVDSDSVFVSKRSALISERTINPAQRQHFWKRFHSTTVILYKNDRSFGATLHSGQSDVRVAPF